MATQSKSMQDLWRDSYLNAGNEAYIEDLYETYLRNPNDVTPEWRNYFDQMRLNTAPDQVDVSHEDVRQRFLQLAKYSQAADVRMMDSAHDEQQERVIELIAAYRRLGHLQANIDPLGLSKGTYTPILEPAYYSLSDVDKQKVFNLGSYTGLNKNTATFSDIYSSLRKVYCGSIGFEYMHINRSDEVEWIRDRIEQGWANFKVTPDQQKHLLQRLVAADGIEKYLGFKYVGQKRFSLEGGDSLIPMLDAIINRTAHYGVKEVVIGMAHRGRLNVLMNVLGKNPAEIFAAFEGKGVASDHSGDVKYHLGYSSNLRTKDGSVHLALAFNPSHLEIVSPVVQGSVRARQRRRRNTDQQQVVPIQIHGDAAFAGQGVVTETFNMSQARWFTVGGSIHIVINNQVGFTTSNPKDARSTMYCTDVAKMVEPPILHVNANDPEAVLFAALFAIDYRHTFKRDVVIDLVCYRRNGHNEADEPSATQPVMYSVIKAMDVPYVIYAKSLEKAGVIGEGEAKLMVDQYRASLDNGTPVVELEVDQSAYEFTVDWEPYVGTKWTETVNTSVPMNRLQQLAARLEQLPDGFIVQPQVKKTLDNQKKMAAGEMPLNWGYAETLAYASLLDEGYAIRLCGQDASRGTFAHRHAVLHDQKTDEVYLPLSNISAKQAHINIVDSLLSEEAVLAFEYGYATAVPNILSIWEAQFGDFANGAQVVVDQFLSSGEQKWGRYCGLVMLLPHGYEGQGPEHSSARLERYLQLCAQDNMQVCTPTTPAQIFHLLRRQMLRPYRKPLIIMSPKSMLRNPHATSPIKELADGEFQLVINDSGIKDAKAVTKIVLCGGKVYYDLVEKRDATSKNNIAIIRIEQLYPFPADALSKLLSTYPNAKEFVWCQEEPQNMGAWLTTQPYIIDLLSKGQTLRYAGRAAAASPAVGSHAVHEQQQQALITDALK